MADSCSAGRRPLGLAGGAVERADCLGGTLVRSGVNCWEMGAGGHRHPLRPQPAAAADSAGGRHLLPQPAHGSGSGPREEKYRFPGGETVIDPLRRRYRDTLCRHGVERPWRGSRIALPRGVARRGVRARRDGGRRCRAMLDETRRCRVLLNTAFQTVGGRGTRRGRLLPDRRRPEDYGPQLRGCHGNSGCASAPAVK